MHYSGGNKKKWKLLDTYFMLPPNYEVIEVIGKGAYGIVVAAKDKDLPEGENLVAIKKMMKVFEHRTYAQRTLRELKMMRLLKHENILSTKTIILPESLEDFNELYVVTELMETDLKSVIRSN